MEQTRSQTAESTQKKGMDYGTYIGIYLAIIMSTAIGYTAGSLSSKVEVPMEPTKIVYEDRNNDGLADMVQKYQNGKEIIIPAHKNKEGQLEYNLNDQ